MNIGCAKLHKKKLTSKRLRRFKKDDYRENLIAGKNKQLITGNYKYL